MKKNFILLSLFLITTLSYGQDETYFCLNGNVFENGNESFGPVDKIGDAAFKIYFKEERIEISTDAKTQTLFFTISRETQLDCYIYYLENVSKQPFRLEICKKSITLYYDHTIRTGKSDFKKVANWICN